MLQLCDTGQGSSVQRRLPLKCWQGTTGVASLLLSRPAKWTQHQYSVKSINQRSNGGCERQLSSADPGPPPEPAKGHGPHLPAAAAASSRGPHMAAGGPCQASCPPERPGEGQRGVRSRPGGQPRAVANITDGRFPAAAGSWGDAGPEPPLYPPRLTCTPV